MIATYHDAAKVMIFKGSIIFYLWMTSTGKNIVNNRNVINVIINKSDVKR